MKYFAQAIEQMRAVDGILIPQFPWPKRRLQYKSSALSSNIRHHKVMQAAA